MKLFNKILLPLLILFVLMNIFIFTAQSLWQKFDVDTNVLIAANILFLAMAIVVFTIQQNALKNPNPNAFVRSIIGGTMIKMFGTVIAVLVYVLQAGNGYSKNAVFVALLMYLFYLAVEVFSMSKIVRNNK
jgi:hypothetical protein